MDLSNQLLHGLKIIPENDRDLKTLTVWSNPNRIRGNNKDLRPKILKILEDLENKGVVSRRKKLLSSVIDQGKQEFELWSRI